ncbi:MAG: ABC transporter ATP-binding protein/permease [Alphaproteobacteria bacterium]|nr:ABC transporter ATP-binding protein/permease [Alphaproteobacteria bacterium]
MSRSQTSKFKTFTKLWPYLWPENMPEARLKFIQASCALIASKVCILIVPFIFKYSIDVLENSKSLFWPLMLMGAYGAARMSSSLFSELRDVTFARVSQRALYQLGLKVFDHLHNLSLRFHLGRQTGGLTRIVERGVKSIETLLTFLTFSLVPIFIEIGLVALALWIFYGVTLAVITLVTMICYILYTLKLTEWRISFVRQMNATDNEAQTKAIDSLLNYETVKYFGNEPYEQKQYGDALKQYEKSALQSKVSLSYLNIGQVVILSIGLVLVMMVAATSVMKRQITIGDFVAIHTFLIQLYIPLFNLGFAYREVKLSLVNLEELFGVLDESREIQDSPDSQPLLVANGEIVFKDVCFDYQPEREIIKGISFTIPAGKTLAIVGSSGAGKSTIARLLFRFYDPTSGSISIDGQDVRAVTQKSLRACIGVVPQDTVLFNNTLYYNIAYGCPDANPEEVDEAARQAQIYDFIQSLPDGYNTQVGERGLKLSGGEKQRVAIARTILKKPSIFLFDEATSSLDTRTEKKIQENLQTISANHTTIIVAHRLSTIVNADQIIVLEKGVIVERGTHQDLLSQKGVYTKMWQRQTRKAG